MGRRATAFFRRRPKWLALAATALLLRLLVPAGFMIGTEGGATGLVPCPQVVAAPVAAAMHHHGSHKVPASHAEAPCPFAALSAPALPPAEPLRAPPPAPDAVAAAKVWPPELPAPAAAAPPPPARGPPVFV